jgi:hypothetical protein
VDQLYRIMPRYFADDVANFSAIETTLPESVFVTSFHAARRQGGGHLHST